MEDKLAGVVVGLRMGKNHAIAMAENPSIDLRGICDISAEPVEEVAAALQSTGSYPKTFTDYTHMLAEIRPDVVTIATPNRLHASMAIEASEAGVKAICCEKPIAVDLGEARRMVDVCRSNGTLLIVNHQRRLGSDFVWVRQQIESGAIGEVYLVRGNCAGDMLSDGTHLVDSTLFLAGDIDWNWVYASYHREDTGGDADSGGGYHVAGGWRFGHPVENGMFTLVELSNGIKIEMLTGDLRDTGRPYHDIEVIGTEGSLRRSGDSAGENLFRRSSSGKWEMVSLPDPMDVGGCIGESYNRLVGLIEEGKDDSCHPLGASNSMRGFEILMGAYESARTGSVLRPPVNQERYPLAVALGLE